MELRFDWFGTEAEASIAKVVAGLVKEGLTFQGHQEGNEYVIKLLGGF